MMKVIKMKTDGTAEATGAIMHKVVNKYYLDMAPYASLSLQGIFDKIKSLPYREDPEKTETLMRPRFTMLMQGSGGDCDCKAIALAAYAKLQGLPCHFVAIRRPGRTVFHHVAVEILVGGHWLFADPTYSYNLLGVGRDEAERKIM